jgi:hypothetical protein
MALLSRSKVAVLGRRGFREKVRDMTYKGHLIVAVIIGIGAFSFAGPVQAGTCQPVKAKGQAPKMATAMTFAQADLKQTAKSIGGKVTQVSSNCVPGPWGYVCKINAVVCPK